jgi:hypothetical protein
MNVMFAYLKLNISGWKEWKKKYNTGKIPLNIPKSPDVVYRSKGWNGIDDFLGKSMSPNNKSKIGWANFETAKKFALTLNLKSGKEWSKFIKSNQNIEINLPSTADRVYAKKGWKGWADFLGKED